MGCDPILNFVNEARVAGFRDLGGNYRSGISLNIFFHIDLSKSLFWSELRETDIKIAASKYWIEIS
jgi:hypothetical protein